MDGVYLFTQPVTAIEHFCIDEDDYEQDGFVYLYCTCVRARLRVVCRQARLLTEVE